MSKKLRATPTPSPEPPAFNPVPVRLRHDGWTPGKQVAFINALAETACVDRACRLVGMSQQSAYALRARPDAQSFRQAWVIALDLGTGKLADKALDRALNGVAVPIYYQGQKVGERRVFNERLTMFLLSHHAADRYGAWRNRMVQVRNDPDSQALLFKKAIRAVAEDALADAAGRPRPDRSPLVQMRLSSEDEGTTDLEAGYTAITEHYVGLIEDQDREIDELRRQLAAVSPEFRSDGEGGSTWPTSDGAEG